MYERADETTKKSKILPMSCEGVTHALIFVMTVVLPVCKRLSVFRAGIDGELSAAKNLLIGANVHES